MEALIRVRMLDSGRIMARVEPLGPVAEADSTEVAIEFAKEAHQAYLRDQARWLPPGLSYGAVTYRVIGHVGLSV